VAVLGGIVGVITWTAQTYASQGRLLFPYIAAISTLLALGLDELFGRIRLRRVESVLAGAYGAFALIVALVSIAPGLCAAESAGRAAVERDSGLRSLRRRRAGRLPN